jgi:hypothetical protein
MAFLSILALSLDTAGCKPADEIPLEEHVEEDHGYGADHRRAEQLAVERQRTTFLRLREHPARGIVTTIGIDLKMGNRLHKFAEMADWHRPTR